MKKWLWISVFAFAFLIGCSPESSATGKQTITVYESDANAEYVIPREVSYKKGTEEALIHFIFDEVVAEKVKLIDYQIEDGTLVLNLDDGVRLVQGSAGGQMFMGSLAESYFKNFPDVQEIVLLHNGSSKEQLDHVFIGQPITREQSFQKPK